MLASTKYCVKLYSLNTNFTVKVVVVYIWCLNNHEINSCVPLECDSTMSYFSTGQ